MCNHANHPSFFAKSIYLVVVKSISLGLAPSSTAFSQVQASAEQVISVCCELEEFFINLPAGRAPQEHKEPLGVAFSVSARSQVQAPAGRAPSRVLAQGQLRRG